MTANNVYLTCSLSNLLLNVLAFPLFIYEKYKLICFETIIQKIKYGSYNIKKANTVTATGSPPLQEPSCNSKIKESQDSYVSTATSPLINGFFHPTENPHCLLIMQGSLQQATTSAFASFSNKTEIAKRTFSIFSYASSSIASRLLTEVLAG